VEAVTNLYGAVTWRTNVAYREVRTGLSYWNEARGGWEDSDPGFEPGPNGTVVAARCQHRLAVAGNVNDANGVVACEMPDGRRLRTAALGLSVFSPVSGRSLQIGSVRDCAGRQTGPAEVTFADCFDGLLKASLRIRNEVGEFHQDLVLHEQLSAEQLARLEALGFDPANLRLEMWSEFLEGPAPAVSTEEAGTAGDATGTEGWAEPGLSDDTVDWGAMRLVRGLSFLSGPGGETRPVFKRWFRSPEGRQCLIESAASYQDLLPLLESLPASRAAAARLGEGAAGGWIAGRRPPRRAVATLGTESARQFAQGRGVAPGGTTGEPGVTLDFTVANGTLTNLVCGAGETIYVSGTVRVVGALTLEGLSVIKYLLEKIQPGEDYVVIVTP
jgi:hypothetical protein